MVPQEYQRKGLGITHNVDALNNATPKTLGLKPSFGFGDRLGLAGPGHVAACRRGGLAPIFAQQSVRELTRTERTMDDVMVAARSAVDACAWKEAWGADGDHLKTQADVQMMADCGCTFFTIDPSEHVNDKADTLGGDDLTQAAQEAVTFGAFRSLEEVRALWLDRKLDLGEGLGAAGFQDEEELLRACAKYGKAVAYTETMSKWIAEAATDWEIEVSVDETETPTSPAEHAFFAGELKRRGVKIVSLAPRFVGDFEKGIDYRGSLEDFEHELKKHVAIAKQLGPYKISVHSGSDKFAVYPIIGRVCGDLLHVKTAGTSYLEALRVPARKAGGLFLEIAKFSLSKFERDCATYHISGSLANVGNLDLMSQEALERHLLDEDNGRQIMHVTYGSVLTEGHDSYGRPFKESLLDLLKEHDELHTELIESHLGRHVELLGAG